MPPRARAWAEQPVDGEVIEFGPYRVYPEQRLILDGDRPLRIGRRALDVLLVLLEQAGTVVSKQQLIARVWPRSVVEDGCLRVHMAALRKALGDGQAGQRYIVTVAQRGYSFVAPLSRVLGDDAGGAEWSADHNLPPRRTRLIGRQELVERLLAELPHKRCITLTGNGGIGKTTVALRVAELLIGRYRDGIRLLDLAALRGPDMLASSLAALLDVVLHGDAPLELIGAHLRERQMLLVIDNCEHLVDSVALLVESLLRAAPQLHILATSREILRAEGEYVQPLEPLACPPSQVATQPEEALRYPALQLLVERAMATQDSFELTTAELPMAIEICHRLDGIPLAIELVAAQLGRFGLAGLLLQFEDSFELSAEKRDTALLRHQTLRATLDWSYDLLAADEQACLRRLGVFGGCFSLEAAGAVADQPGEVLRLVTQLVAKSLLIAELGDDEVSYHLLESSRHYALEKLEAAGELFATRVRHAELCLALMGRAHDDWHTLSTQRWLACYAGSLGDVRAALHWGLAPAVRHPLAIRLAALSTPLWQELSLLREHGLHVDRALALLAEQAAPAPQLVMDLNLAFGSIAYHAQGGSPQTVQAFERALQIAEQSADVAGQLRAISGHLAVNLCCGRYPEALAQSQSFARLADGREAALALSAQRLRVLGQHFAGDQLRARANAEQVLLRMAGGERLNRFTHGFGVQYDQRVASLTILARIVWLQGFPERAAALADEALAIAQRIDHGTSVCYTLAIAGCAIAQYNGDRARAGQLLDLLFEEAQRHSVLLFLNWAHQYAQALGRGPTPAARMQPWEDEGLIRDILLTLGALPPDALTVERAQSGAAGWCAAEILRRHGLALLERGDWRGAEGAFGAALTLAQRQGALAWELRSATSLAQLYQRQGRDAAARALLAPVCARFSEGWATPDLQAARRCLEE